MLKFLARSYRDGHPVRIDVQDGRMTQIESVDLPEPEVINLPFVGPGLFDIQLNGYGGDWFGSESLTVDTVERIIAAFVRLGITRCFPTLITCSFESMLHGIQTIRKATETSELVRDVVRGIHLEGPYISPTDGPRGAHPLQHVRSADIREFQRWQAESDNTVKLVTLAPEADQAMSLIRYLSGAGVIASLGHTAANPECISEAVSCGARLSTHLGNGCAAMVNRHTNIFWPQLAEDRLTASVISDGWHVPAEMLNCILRCKTAERMIITCDVSGFGGCAPGTYDSDGVAVEILDDGRIVVAGQRQFLAGSASGTGDCVLHMARTCRLSLGEAWHMASENPSAMFGEKSCALRIGAEATLTLFDIKGDVHSSGCHRTAGQTDMSLHDRKFAAVATLIQGRLASGELIRC